MLCPKIDENTLMEVTSAKKLTYRNQPHYTHFALWIPIEHCPGCSVTILVIYRSHLAFKLDLRFTSLRGRNEAKNLAKSDCTRVLYKVSKGVMFGIQYYNTEHDSPVKSHFLVLYQVRHTYVCYLEEDNNQI